MGLTHDNLMILNASRQVSSNMPMMLDGNGIPVRYTVTSPTSRQANMMEHDLTIPGFEMLRFGMVFRCIQLIPVIHGKCNGNNS